MVGFTGVALVVAFVAVRVIRPLAGFSKARRRGEMGGRDNYFAIRPDGGQERRKRMWMPEMGVWVDDVGRYQAGESDQTTTVFSLSAVIGVSNTEVLEKKTLVVTVFFFDLTWAWIWQRSACRGRRRVKRRYYERELERRADAVEGGEDGCEVICRRKCVGVRLGNLGDIRLGDLGLVEDDVGDRTGSDGAQGICPGTCISEMPGQPSAPWGGAQLRLDGGDGQRGTQGAKYPGGGGHAGDRDTALHLLLFVHVSHNEIRKGKQTYLDINRLLTGSEQRWHRHEHEITDEQNSRYDCATDEEVVNGLEAEAVASDRSAAGKDLGERRHDYLEKTRREVESGGTKRTSLARRVRAE
ncbi:hypothetical protein B0H17DRAFT_1154033 [Mycena rosella]|uniref:Uncharacterized protein n=1 Tax=Mycena rosella TaxID=1033263 RepID=A0AAD7B0H4_MYCRO|nr:hypothetical protein B0H17DRAFT_1154033 [Mycena rosella]